MCCYKALLITTCGRVRAWETVGRPAGKTPGGPLNSDLAVQDHHVLGVRGQPRLHGLTYATDLIQRRGMQVWPAEVVDLVG